MHDAADFIARNAVFVLSLVTLMMLALSAVFWRLVTHYGPRSWSLVVRAWNWLRATGLGERVQRVRVLGPMLAGAMTTARYLGLFAVLAFIAAAGLLSMFFEVADEIGVDESLGAFDVALSAALREHLTGDVLRAFALVTHLGDKDVLIAVALAVLAILLALRRWMLAGAWAFATAFGGLLNKLLKSIFERARPLHDHGFATEADFSFPSGHASGSLLVYGLLAYLIVRHTRPVWHIPVALAGLALIIFVGSSRVILQVHYLSDVLAGYASAAAWVALCIAGLEAVRWREARLR